MEGAEFGYCKGPVRWIWNRQALRCHKGKEANEVLLTGNLTKIKACIEGD